VLILGVSAIVVLLILTGVIKIVREHERGVISRQPAGSPRRRWRVSWARESSPTLRAR
jgi:hypothetical protein